MDKPSARKIHAGDHAILNAGQEHDNASGKGKTGRKEKSSRKKGGRNRNAKDTHQLANAHPAIPFGRARVDDPTSCRSAALGRRRLEAEHTLRVSVSSAGSEGKSADHSHQTVHDGKLCGMAWRKEVRERAIGNLIYLAVSRGTGKTSCAKEEREWKKDSSFSRSDRSWITTFACASAGLGTSAVAPRTPAWMGARTGRYCGVVHERGDDKANRHGGGMAARLEVGRVRTGRCAGALREVAGPPGRISGRLYHKVKPGEI
ncbi:hypothetical protein B0H13DRAFT_1860947 [Mycena leptocephala]|nr:hypothetical protein B0H13DRAFT_1860947 [Mycena leptocephala]